MRINGTTIHSLHILSVNRQIVKQNEFNIINVSTHAYNTSMQNDILM